jgi:hypothetical protein
MKVLFVGLVLIFFHAFTGVNQNTAPSKTYDAKGKLIQ